MTPTQASRMVLEFALHLLAVAEMRRAIRDGRLVLEP